MQMSPRRQSWIKNELEEQTEGDERDLKEMFHFNSIDLIHKTLSYNIRLYQTREKWSKYNRDNPRLLPQSKFSLFPG